MTMKQNVSIKGTKDGLVFLLNEHCSFEELLSELKDKLENSHQGILEGPLMRVTLKTGYRKLTDSQEELLRQTFKLRGNLIIYSIENEIDAMNDKLKGQVKVIKGIIRSGQIYRHEGSILLLGDINPGGNLIATGDIYVLGSLLGMAHAGSDGNKNAIIAASIMKPTLLKVGDIVSEPNEEQFKSQALNQYAYIEENRIVISQFKQFFKLRKAIGTFI